MMPGGLYTSPTIRSNEQRGMVMRRCNQVASILLLILSIAAIVGSRDLIYKVEFSPGAGFFPFWLGVSLLILSLILLTKNTVLKSVVKEENPLPGREALLRIVSILGALLVGILLFERIGFLITMCSVSAFMLIFLEKYRWYSGILISLVMVFAVYGIFKIWLNVPLPLGLLHG
jgi:putative tricarboxylic transport membrane protein